MLRFLFQPKTKKEQSDSKAFFDQMHDAYDQSGLKESDAIDDTQEVFDVLCEEYECDPHSPLTRALHEFLEKLAVESDLYGVLECALPFLVKDIEADSLNRQRMLRKITLYEHAKKNRERVRTTLYEVGASLLEAIPDTVFQTPEPDSICFDIATVDVLENPAAITQSFIETFYTQDLNNTALFYTLRNTLDNNVERVSTTVKKNALPVDLKDKYSPQEIIEHFLQGTSLTIPFEMTVPFFIPLDVRFEHTYLCAGSGHGKTQTLQYMMCRDLNRALEGNGGFAVIDSQGDLFDSLVHLADLKQLQDRVVIIDANDVEYPIALNLFDLHEDRLGKLKLEDREKIINSSLDTFEYIFRSLLGAELTQKQGAVFNYVIRAMLSIPGATIRTLQDFLLNGQRYLNKLEGLDGATRHFFETQFFTGSFSRTRQEINHRLLGVLSQPLLARMLNTEKNKVDMFEAMNTGKIVLVNTAKDLLKTERSSIFGRVIIAMIYQAAMSRILISKKQRTPFFVYIDEAHEYFDEKMSDIANQARKMKVAMTVAHQQLSQAKSGELRAALMTSTSTKMIGGVSAEDASVFSKNMRTTPSDILSVKKPKKNTEFLCYVRNITPKPVVISIPFGELEKRERLSRKQYKKMIDENRKRVAIPLSEIDDSYESFLESGPVTEEPKMGLSAEQKTPNRNKSEFDAGKGGEIHKQIQNDLMLYANSLGYGAHIEQRLKEGGFADLIIFKNDFRAACEISVTTSPKHELGNIRKCFDAGYETVYMIAKNKKSIASIQNYVEENIAQQHKIQYHTVSTFKSHLSDLCNSSYSGTSHGYNVETKYMEISKKARKQKRGMIQIILDQEE